MELYEAKRIIKMFAENGCKSVTLTGGGETLLHPNISEIIESFIHYNIEVGLVTNGTLLHKNINLETLNKVTWCRISNGDFRTFDLNYETSLEKVVNCCPDVDWAFSHVVSKEPNIDEIERVLTFANNHFFTHVRLVADLFETENVDLGYVKHCVSVDGYNDSKVIYQGRKEPEHGGDCYICWLKPVISADSKAYFCCGSQYSIDGKHKKMPDELCFGSVDQFIQRLDFQTPMNGNVCDKCYYMNYNRVLGSMINDLEHKEFI